LTEVSNQIRVGAEEGQFPDDIRAERADARVSNFPLLRRIRGEWRAERAYSLQRRQREREETTHSVYRTDVGGVKQTSP